MRDESPVGAMTPKYEIDLARAAEVPLLPAIELAAATLFDGHGLDSVIAETTTPEVFLDAARRGQLWVARAPDGPVGFALVKVIEPTAVHLEELDVHPEHGRRGIGRRLVAAVCEWAGSVGYRTVTLTTFRDLPWNMPFYAQLGFEAMPPDAFGPALRSIVDYETGRGLDPARRLVMRRSAAWP